jgi:hypothetical protein
MHSPTLALTWQLWGRHRWGLAAVFGYCLTTAVVFNALPAGSLEVRHGGLMSIQFVIALIYVAAVFAYGFESWLETRESGFPSRLFTLPVRTSVLMGWPMLQGMATVALLWLAWARFVLWPSGIEVPLGSTALHAAACVAVLQALLWSPFGLPWVRVVLALVLLPLLAVAPQLGAALGVRESMLFGLDAALIPLAALTAFAAVSRARHGEAPDWLGLLRRPRALTRRPWRRLAPFASAARAQLWFEGRRCLLTFPLIVAAFSVLHLTVTLGVERPPAEPGRRLLLALNFVIFPLIVAPFLGCFLGLAGTAAGNPYSLSSFTATRPVRGTFLVAAKLQVAALGTLAAWVVVLLAASIWFAASDSFEKLLHVWRGLVQNHGPWRAAATAALVTVALPLLTWRLLVDQLWIGLAGRAWIHRGSLVAYGLGLTLVVMLLGWWANNAEDAGRLWLALPWWAGGAALLKLLAAAGVLRALLRRDLIGRPALAKRLAVWLLAVAGLFVLACAALPPDAAPVSLLASGAVLFVPLVRLSAAPLALAWNRHR